MGDLILHCAPAQPYYYFEKQYLKNTSGSMYLLPVNRAVRIFRQGLIERSGEGALIAPAVFTFDQLLLELYKALPGSGRIISAASVQVILEQVLEKNRTALTYFKSPSATPSPGLVQKIGDILSELRRFGYNYEAFSKLSLEDKIRQPQKYNDFEQLLKSLDSILQDRLIDEPFARHLASEQITKKQFQHLFPEVQKIFITGYGLFSPAMFRFIQRASDWCQVHIRLEYDARNPDLFKHTQPAYQRLMAMGARESNYMALAPLAANLFFRGKKTAPAVPPRARIRLCAVSNQADEVEWIATEIRRLHLEEGIPLSRMAITMANPERYAGTLQEVLPGYGIPFNLSTGFKLKQAPLIQLYLRALHVIRSGYVWKDIHLLLNHPLVILPDIDLPELHRLLTQARMQRLTGDWWEKVKSSTVFSQLSAPRQQKVSRAAEWTEEFLRPFRAFPLRASMDGFHTAFRVLLIQTGFLHWFTTPAKHLGPRRREAEFRAFNRFIKVLDQMVWITTRIHAGEQLPFERFLKYLETAIESAVYNLTEWPGYGVQIMPRLEVQALEARVLFIAGLIDGEFPRAANHDVFFNDQVRDQMGLLATEDLLAQDRFIFYTLLDGAGEQVVLSYPQYDDDRALVASTFISDLREIVDIEEVQKSEGTAVSTPRHYWNAFGLAIQQNNFTEAQSILPHLLSDTGKNRAPIRHILYRLGGQYRRRMLPGFDRLEGMLSSEDDIKRLLQKKYARQNWSASRLEAYGFCPMQYFLQYELKLDPPEPEEKRLTPLERGTFVHEILYRFYSELKDLGDVTNPAKYKDRLKEIAREELKKMPFEGFFWELDQALYLGSAGKPGLLDLFVEQEQETLSESDSRPEAFECDFGAPAGEPLVLKGSSGAIQLQGRIDRIDLLGSDQAMVIDYKTGTSAAKRTAGDVLDGYSFQLPLYMKALEQIYPKRRAVMGLYYVLKDMNNCQRKVYLADRESFEGQTSRSTAWLPHKKIHDAEGNVLSLEQLLQFAVDLAIEKVGQLQNGVFRHTRFPKNAACASYCGFRRICQKSNDKITRSDALEAAAEGESV